jgi:hypothetical protein
VIEEDNSPDLLGAIRELIEEGIVSLVIDPKTISDKEISDEMLPSIVEILSEDKEGFSFSNLFKKMKIGGKDSGTGSLFSGFGDYSLKALIGEGAKEIGERLLVQEYINDHFAKFSEKEEEIKGRKPSVLTYEREYLLYGNRSDKENLEAIIGRLILLRTLLNFTTILADKDIRGDARIIAGKLVGFLGLPILVTLTQGILMILLAFASALVDTRALLIGKEVAILKKKVELEFSDLLLLTRDNINKKAEAYKENGLSYNNYLSIFLCLTNQKKLTYRMMDLIQENIKIRYGTDFKLENCLFAYEAKAKFKIRPIFTNFSFIREYINTSYNNVFAIQAECSY